jgi:predicted transposase/invertase (TIGR01784 family)
MKTDSLFYRIFQTAPGIVLELAGASPSEAIGYEFRSVELKQTAFRIDGVLIPTQDNQNQPTYFVEVQFQRDDRLYHRFFAELFLYLAQNPNTADWRGVLIYFDRSIRPEQTPLYQQLIDSDKVQEIYLTELENLDTLSLGIRLIKLIVEPEPTSINQAKALIERSDQGSTFGLSQTEILDLVETILIYKFNSSREEVANMIKLYELEETRFYQEVSAESIHKDHQKNLEELLNDRFGLPTEPNAIQERLEVVQTLLQLEGTLFFQLTRALARESSQRSLMETLKVRFQEIPAPIMAKIEQATNATQEGWIWLALKVESIAEFAEAISIENDSLNLLNQSNPT